MAQYKEQDEDVLTYALFPQVAMDFFKYRQAQKLMRLWQIPRTAHTRYKAHIEMQTHFNTGKGACCMQAPLCIKKIKKAG